MPTSFWKLFALCLVPLLCSLSSAAQQAGAASGFASIPNLRLLTRNSGYIFTGTVIAVDHAGPAGPKEVGTTRTTFKVERGMRGVHTGQMLTIREWAGVWESGERYRPGERVLLFLYPPSKLGLTSTVGGAMGRFGVDGRGQIVLARTQKSNLLSDPATESRLRRRSPLSRHDPARAIPPTAEE